MTPPRSYVFFGLNAVRFISLVSLILVFASSIFVLVTDIEAVNRFEADKHSNNNTESFIDCDYIDDSTVPNQPAGVFWAVVNRLLIIFQAIILILSEIGWPATFFDRFFPVLGPSFGLGALGIFQALLGTAILSHHTDEFSLVSAFFVFSIGCLNALLGLIFRESARTRRSISAWHGESKGEILPTHRPIIGRARESSAVFTSISPSFITEKTAPSPAAGQDEFGAWKGYGFGRQGEKKAGLKGFLLSRPVESLPRYASRPTSAPSVSHTDEKEEKHHHEEDKGEGSSRAATPIPTFMSSPTAI